MMMKNIMEPMTLNSRCITAARFALMFAPMDESSAVTQVPMLEPMTTKRTSLPPSPIIMPLPSMAMSMDVTAEELCMIAVTAMPRKKSRNGFVTLAKALTTAALSRKRSMESDMTSRPTKTSPRPASAYATVWTFSFLLSMAVSAPMPVSPIAKIAMSNAESAAICAVMVVPMFAPMMIAVAW